MRGVCPLYPKADVARTSRSHHQVPYPHIRFTLKSRPRAQRSTRLLRANSWKFSEFRFGNARETAESETRQIKIPKLLRQTDTVVIPQHQMLVLGYVVFAAL